MKDYKYYAFISYKREDEEWAKWLQNKLEYFKLPVNLNSTSNEEEYIRPVFRDITDLRPGCLPEHIREALDESKFLIAVCSPRYSKSKWCDEEVKYFKETGRIRNVIPFIIDGKPYSVEEECFPPSLSELKGSENELLGADVRTLSNDYALVQIVATMFGVDVDSIWKRYLKDEEEAKRKLKEQNDHLLSLQSRITASKAQNLIEDWPYDESTAGRLILEVLPSNCETPERPWVTEAEYVLRRVLHKNNLIQDIHLPEKKLSN